MSDKIKNIMEKLKADPELAGKYKEELGKLKQSDAASSDVELICKAIKNVTGEDISIAEFERIQAGTQELSSDELEKVSGGGSGWCWSDYYCLIAYEDASVLYYW